MASKKKKPEEPTGSTDQNEAANHENMTDPIPASDNPSVSAPDEAGDKAQDVESQDELLDDVRRALIEDEAHDTQKQSKWWKRIGIGGGRHETRPQEPPVIEEIDLPASQESSATAEIEDLKEELQSEEYLEQIDDLIELLDDDTAPTVVKPEKVEEPPVEPEKPADLEQLKKQAFQPRMDAADAETLSEVRSIALEGDEEVFVEVESKPPDTLDERVKAVENAFMPYRRYVFFTIAFLGVVMAAIALLIMVNTYQRLRPQPTAAVVSDLPYPTSVSLPGGWAFNLGRGTLADGRWRPQGAEWLEGTEVCRWVSLPWSRQLEAVVRTLNPEDPIELGMSNSDRLIYKVYSVRQMSPDEMQSLDTNTPCLLIMLTEDDAEKHWVLTALP